MDVRMIWTYNDIPFNCDVSCGPDCSSVDKKQSCLKGFGGGAFRNADISFCNGINEAIYLKTKQNKKKSGY